VTDPELGEPGSEAAGGEGRAVVRAKHELPRLETVDGRTPLDDSDRLVGAAAQHELPGDDLAGTAVDDRDQVAPAVLGHPHARHVQLPELARPLDPEEAGPFPPLQGTATLDQLLLPHHPQHALAVDCNPELLPGQRRDHPVPVGLVGAGGLHDRGLDRIRGRPPLRNSPRGRHPVERLAADTSDTRHDRGRVPLSDELTRAGDAQPHSHSRKSFPAISSS
jgi:hypothetical protein